MTADEARAANALERKIDIYLNESSDLDRNRTVTYELTDCPKQRVIDAVARRYSDRWNVRFQEGGLQGGPYLHFTPRPELALQAIIAVLKQSNQLYTMGFMFKPAGEFLSYGDDPTNSTVFVASTSPNADGTYDMMYLRRSVRLWADERGITVHGL